MLLNFWISSLEGVIHESFISTYPRHDDIVGALTSTLLSRGFGFRPRIPEFNVHHIFYKSCIAVGPVYLGGSFMDKNRSEMPRCKYLEGRAPPLMRTTRICCQCQGLTSEEAAFLFHRAIRNSWVAVVSLSSDSTSVFPRREVHRTSSMEIS